jgi:hypothetical protein
MAAAPDSDALVQLAQALFLPLREPSIARKAEFEHVCHYTSAAGFADIIASGEIWLSNVSTMNDRNEVIAGAQHIYNFYLEKKDSLFESIPELRDVLKVQFEHLFDRIHQDTYAFCFSGHNSSDNLVGRLPMWRAYGADGDGVCVVMDKDKLLVNAAGDIPLYWTAMIYETPAEYTIRITKFFEHVELLIMQHRDALISLPLESIAWSLGFSMVTLALTHKHPAFREEHEFRYIHLMGLLPMNQPDISYFPARSGNKLRPVLRVPIRSYENGADTLGGSIQEVFKCVIVGPSDDHQMQKRAAMIALARAGCGEIPVFFSEIPYRKNR